MSDEGAIGFLLHEAIHTLLARPAWDHTLSGCTYNWTIKGTIITEEHPIVIYGRHIIQALNIQAAATASAAEWNGDIGVNTAVDRWKQPGADLMSHDNMGKPTNETLAKTIKTLAICGVTDEKGKLIGPFNPNMSNNKIKKLKGILKTEDVLGLVPQIGSPVDIAKIKKAA